LSPALADIIGGRRVWTVAMISPGSIPWRQMLVVPTLQCSELLARGAPAHPLLHAEQGAGQEATLAGLRAAHLWERVPEPV
jgi:hypothetical protein